MSNVTTKKKSASTIIFGIFKVLFIVITVAASAFSLMFGTGEVQIFSQNEALSVKPAGEVIELTELISAYEAYDFSSVIEDSGEENIFSYISEHGSEQEIIHLCNALYNTANQNYKTINACAYEVNSLTSVVTAGLEAPVNGYRYCLKSGEEFFYSEYSIPPEDSAMGAIMGAFVAESSNFAKRQYGTIEMTQMVEQKVLKPNHKLTSGKHIFEADWSKATTNKYVELPIFCSSQVGDFSYTDIVINANTIDTATISYDSELGVYTMDLILDCTNSETTKNTIKNVRDSSGCKDAVYTSITEKIKIWDNGYFKYFLSVDDWQGTGGTGAMTSTINFETNFFYDAEHLDLGTYQYGEEFKELIADPSFWS